MSNAQHASFSGSIPSIYDRHLVPVLLEPFARDLARRIPKAPGLRVLEVAAGTGIVTRYLAEVLPADGSIVATDLNTDMLEHARAALGGDPRIEWRTADAQSLPFDNGSFDVFVMQFGIMFVPDKLLALREAKRVLKPGGRLLLNAWDAFETNPFGRVANQVIRATFPVDPPTFYQTPFGDHDPEEHRARALAAGFREVQVEPVECEGTSESAEHLAIGLVRGNPVSIAIQERGELTHAEVIERMTSAVRREMGDHPVRVPLKAWVVSATA